MVRLGRCYRSIVMASEKKLIIGQKVSGTYWNKGSDRRGNMVPIFTKPFIDGVVIGFTSIGNPIIEITSGNLRFKAYRTKITS